MRWLFIGVLAFLIACVLSIIWMNDPNLGPAMPSGQIGQGSEQQNPLTGQPPTRN